MNECVLLKIDRLRSINFNSIDDEFVLALPLIRFTFSLSISLLSLSRTHISFFIFSNYTFAFLFK